MPHHMVVRKERPKKDRTRKSPLPEDWEEVKEKVFIPKAGRPNDTYRDGRRNIFHEVNGEGVLVRQRNPNPINLAESERKTFVMEQPEFIRRISNRGEVHYVRSKD